VKIRLSIVEDDSLLSDLLAAFLLKEGFELAGVYTHAEAFLEDSRTETQPPDVLLLDLKLEGMNGIELLDILRRQSSPIQVIALSSYYKPDSFGFMIKSGVAAFLPKEVSPTTLVEAIERVAKDGHFLLTDQVELLRTQLSSRIQEPVLESANALSEREIEILRLLAEQKTAKEIADQLFVTPRTIEGHKNNLFAKTGAKNLAGLIIYGVQHGFIEPGVRPDF
jgi:DNA-binding NarL/FixJ family response regulator